MLTRGELAPKITAKHVLACSHFPFYEGLGLYSTRMHADRSYALAVKAKKKFPEGIYISADEPTRSLRSVTVNGEEMVLIVGENHKTGQGIETMEHYQALETFGEEVFGFGRNRLPMVSAGLNHARQIALHRGINIRTTEYLDSYRFP